MPLSSVSSPSSRVRRTSFIDILIVLFLAISLAAAEQHTSTSPSSTPATPTIVPGSNGYGYIGCYNETTNLSGTSSGTRALYGGDNEVIPEEMTVERCLRFCKSGMGGRGYRFAGVEYSRKCWCATQLSSLSAKVADTECNLPCDGDESQICGGDLKISVYDMNSVAASFAPAKERFFFMGLLAAVVTGMHILL
ncbi:WSC domain-containing protein [Sordaria brevicollis]|uniref:WSC domain-containing protein n=1 Tax=Sordaria brevicollis TaxID=83679 RepID=A0AAE0NW65_SORBR|nr:WSC domain-containing protein [Sordaria brevicollis]